MEAEDKVFKKLLRKRREENRATEVDIGNLLERLKWARGEDNGLESGLYKVMDTADQNDEAASSRFQKKEIVEFENLSPKSRKERIKR